MNIGFVVDALAIYRLTRLATTDQITEEVRELILQEISTLSNVGVLSEKTVKKITYLAYCDWCMSIWAASLALILKTYTPDLWKNIRFVLATSAVAGLISSYQ
jgi:hypothetical protein